MPKYQPYYLAYCRAVGIEPGEGITYQFALWMQRRWEEWYRVTGHDRDKPMTDLQRQHFGRWLKTRAEALRGYGPLYHRAEGLCHVMRKKPRMREWSGFTTDTGEQFRRHMQRELRRRGALGGHDGVRFKECWSEPPRRLVWIHPGSHTVLTYLDGNVTVSKVSPRTWNSVIEYLEKFYAQAS